MRLRRPWPNRALKVAVFLMYSGIYFPTRKQPYIGCDARMMPGRCQQAKSKGTHRRLLACSACLRERGAVVVAGEQSTLECCSRCCYWLGAEGREGADEPTEPTLEVAWSREENASHNLTVG